MWSKRLSLGLSSRRENKSKDVLKKDGLQKDGLKKGAPKVKRMTRDSHIEKLPVEIVLQILSELSYAQLRPIRLAGSRYLREVIHNHLRPSYQTFIEYVRNNSSLGSSERLILVAASDGHFSLARHLLNDPLDGSNERILQKAMMHAAKMGHEEIMDMFLTHTAQLHYSNIYSVFSVTHLHKPIPCQYWSIFHEAVLAGHEGMVKLIFKSICSQPTGWGMFTSTHSIRQEYRNIEWMSGLAVAAHTANECLIKLLLSWGADVNYVYQHLRCSVFKVDVTKSCGKQEGRDNNAVGYAAKEGHYGVVNLLIQNGADLNWKGMFEQSPLHYAAQNGHDKVCALLIEKGADMNSKDRYHETPIHQAAQNGHVNVCALLIEKGADVNPEGLARSSPLHYATINGHISTCTLLLENGANVNTVNESMTSPLHDAVGRMDFQMVKLLLDHKADGSDGSVINIACHEQSLVMVRTLLSYGIPAAYPGSLIVAIQKGDIELIQLLLAHHDFSSYSRESDYTLYTLLRTALEKKIPGILPLWLKHMPKPIPKHEWISVIQTIMDVSGEDHDFRDMVLTGVQLNYIEEDHMRMLIWGSIRFKQHTYCLELLSALPVYKNMHKQLVNETLLAAAQYGNKDVVDVALAEGADVDFLAIPLYLDLVGCVNAENQHRNAFQLAALNGKWPVADRLLHVGAEVDMKNDQGKTALHMAVEAGVETAIKALLKRGASRSAVDCYGKMAIDYIQMDRRHEYLAALLDPHSV